MSHLTILLKYGGCISFPPPLHPPHIHSLGCRFNSLAVTFHVIPNPSPWCGLQIFRLFLPFHLDSPLAGSDLECRSACPHGQVLSTWSLVPGPLSSPTILSLGLSWAPVYSFGNGRTQCPCSALVPSPPLNFSAVAHN